MMQDAKWKLGEELEWRKLFFTKKTDPSIKKDKHYTQKKDTIDILGCTYGL